MAKPTKDAKNLNCRIDRSVAELLEKYIADTGMSKTATVERALKEYIEQRMEKEKKGKK